MTTTTYRVERKGRTGDWALCRSDGLDEAKGLGLLERFRREWPGEEFRLLKVTTEVVDIGGNPQ